MDNIKAIEEQIIKYLSQELGAILILIFGSSAHNKQRPDSDIDIAFIGKNKPASLDIFSSAQQLSYLLRKDVDLIDLAQASPVLQVQILKNGRIIYEQNPHYRKEFFMLALKQYCRLNEERTVVIEKIKERGQIYGG